MHKRPPPAHRLSGRPRATVITANWGNPDNERYFATRALAGAMSTVADVTILHLTSGEVRGPRRDGAFGVVRVAATEPRPIEEALVLATLNSARLPRMAGQRLHALGGGAPAHDHDFAAQIAATEPDVVVIAGLNQSWPASALDCLARRPRIVTMPLAGDDPRLTMGGYLDLISAADIVLSTSPAERALLASIGLRAELVELPLPVPVNLASATYRVAGLTNFDDYAVFLRGFPDGTVELPTSPDYLQLRDAVPGLGVADITHKRWHVYNDDFDYVIPIGPSRVNLWRLLSHAVALVDLRPGGIIAREAIESLLLGTPVVVPSTSRARGVVEESGGGFVYKTEGEMVSALAELADANGPKRDEVAAKGREWARRVHGDQGRFVAEVTRGLFGS